MERSEQIDKLMAALVAAHSEVENPGFDARNPHFGNRYASLPEVRAAVKPVLARHGLAVVQWFKGDEAGTELYQLVVHSSGQFLQLGPTFVPVSKKDPQGMGSAMTYARRYGLQALLGVAAEDDDAEAATGRVSPTNKAAVAAKK